jgi:hypothetical protein
METAFSLLFLPGSGATFPKRTKTSPHSMKTKINWRNSTSFVFANAARLLDNPRSPSLAFALNVPPLCAIYAWIKPMEGEQRPTAARTWDTKTTAQIFLTVLATLLWVSSPSAKASELIYSQYSDNQSTYGPSLVWAADGVNGEVADEFNALANPTLELRDTNGTVLIANNDWQDNPAPAAELTAAGLAPTNNLESAIAATLPPGLYTTLLSGKNNGTGIGLVEVYDRGAP